MPLINRLIRLISCTLLLAALAGCNLIYGEPTPTPQRDAPVIRFQIPANNAIFPEGTEVDIELLAEDPLGTGVARVELYADDLLHQTGMPEVSAAVPVFTVRMNWLAQGEGLHSLMAIAYRLDGTPSDPATILLEVQPLPAGTPVSTPSAQVG